MNKKKHFLLFFVTDFFTINLSWIFFFFFRVEGGIINLTLQPAFWLPSFAIYFYWLILFFFIGMYNFKIGVSRLDELTKLLKTSFFGILILFFLIFIDDTLKSESSPQRYIIVIYWLIFFSTVGIGRLLILTIIRWYIVKGVICINSLILGFNDKAKEISDQITNYKALGLKVIGFISMSKEQTGLEHNGIIVLDSIENIKEIIQKESIKEIIISLESHEHNKLLEVLKYTYTRGVQLKIVPDMYEIISGQARTNQVYGFPLINVMPELMTDFEKKIKRLLDIVISLIILLFSFPFIILTSVLIKLDSKGPVFFVQIRVGKDGKKFRMLKFRSMIQDAETLTGPVWTKKDDPRITNMGKFIRKTRFDEIPQFINVLKGEMSLVGPRPEVPHFVEILTKEIPFYERRLLVRPGITGWAQVRHKYDESIEDVKKKLEFDFYYIENCSIKLDLSILFRTLFIVLFGKGHYKN